MSFDERLALPGLGLSVVPRHVWTLAPLPPEVLREGLGVFLVHAATGINLNVRVLSAQPALPVDDFPAASERFFTHYWPGPRRMASFSTDALREGVVAVFDAALPSIPDAIIREWFFSDGTRFVNAATYATERQWQERLLGDCEALLRSIQIE